MPALVHLEGRRSTGDPDSKVHGASMGPIWGRHDPGGPNVGPINFALWGHSIIWTNDNQVPWSHVASQGLSGFRGELISHYAVRTRLLLPLCLVYPLVYLSKPLINLCQYLATPINLVFLYAMQVGATRKVALVIVFCNQIRFFHPYSKHTHYNIHWQR